MSRSVPHRPKVSLEWGFAGGRLSRLVPQCPALVHLSGTDIGTEPEGLAG